MKFAFGFLSALLVLALSSAAVQAQQVACSVQQPPSDAAAQAYARQDYAKAFDLYSAAVKTNAKDLAAVAGQIRSLLREQQIDAAADLAQSSVARQGQSAVLTTVLGEVRYRQGRLADAVNTYRASMKLDPCLARTRYDLYRIMQVESMHASAYAQLQTAHLLTPNDPEIQVAWIETLPLAERARQIDSYLLATKGLPADRERHLKEYAERLRAILAARQGGCHVTSSSPTATTLPFRYMVDGPNRITGLGFEVKVNHKAKALLELDTGASGILLNRNTARKAGLVAVTTDSIRGLGDEKSTKGYWAYADDLTLGGLEFKNCLVEVSDKRSVVEVDGLIGANVFENYHVQLDFPMRQMSLSPLPQRPGEGTTQAGSLNAAGVAGGAAPQLKPAGATPSQPAIHYTDRYVSPEMQSWSPFARVGHQILVNGELKDRMQRLFLLDSGSNISFLSVGAARSIGKIHSDQMDQIIGLNGRVKKVYTANNVDLMFAGLRGPFRQIVVMNLAPLSVSNGIEISGIIGLDTMQVLTVDIDYRDGLIHLAYDPKRGMNRQYTFTH